MQKQMPPAALPYSFFFQAEDGIRDADVTGVQTCALPILERALETLRPLTKQRLIVVFGAGGDRDRGKRAPMGTVAVRLAEVTIVTSDNPRTEDPEKILDDVEVGMRARPHHREVDRRRAIARALQLARPGDTILLAGKGHETYQVIGTEKQPFDERAIVRELGDS